MDTGMRTYGDELVAVLSAATAVLSDLPARVHRLTGPDLAAVLPLVDRLAAVAGAGRFTLTADAVDRGEVASSQAGSTQQWVADRPNPATALRAAVDPARSASMMLVVRSTKLARVVLPALAATSVRPGPHRVLQLPRVVEVESAEQGLTAWGRGWWSCLLLWRTPEEHHTCQPTGRDGVKPRG